MGVEAEMELPFAGVHQLCAPMLGNLRALPEPQQDALTVALGLSSGNAPDRFLVGLAVLSLLSAVAEEQPLLCFVDDAQWLDAASSQVLGFVGRRLFAEEVGMLFALRGSATRPEFQGLPELLLGGLELQDARALLARVIPGRLDDRVRERIVAETRGNPLALLELPRNKRGAELAGGFGLLAAGDLPAHLEQHYNRRVDTLPDETQRLMLLAAADPVGDPTLVWRAADTLGIGPGALASAEDAELLEIGEQVRFGHPLVRSAIYRAASPDDRRAVHRALAEATDSEVDADRRAWHLAAAAAGPDEDVAAELERSAGRAQARGGLAAAAAFLRRSVALTKDPDRRVDRALAAAQACLQAGAFDAALTLCASAASRPLDAYRRAKVDLLHGQIAFAARHASDAPSLLLKAAKQLEPLDLRLARETYLSAIGAAAFALPASARDLMEVCHAVNALPRPTQAPRALDVLLDGLALAYTDGPAAAAPLWLQAADAFASNDVPVDECLRWGWLATSAGNALWDGDRVHAVCERPIRLARDVGALSHLPVYLDALSTEAARRGDFSAANSLIAERDAITAATGSQLAPFTELAVAALRGREADASALIATTIKQAAEWGQGLAATAAHWAAAILYNGLGRYEDAFRAAHEATSNPLELFTATWALPELVEAGARRGATDAARAALERLAATARPAGTDLGLGIVARSQALLSEGEAADRLYQEAVERLGRTQRRPDLARAHLLYGEWLRREDRRAEARAQLRTAYDLLTAIGMDAFAERARRELQATGEKVRKPTVETLDELTPHERQIARLARDGLSNPEIGAQLFLSPRTVEWHLRKVFAKLEIESRKELANALPERAFRLVSD
ncbi:MAG: LuxR C-terminal-related transcriptional regulator [Chloroflexota bacterium]|nr:LuxR C-terminal-related transcriptional regulator [Chloroflexota bacterium]